MKIAVLSESTADEAAVRIIVDGILGEASDDVSALRLRSRGWPSVERVLPFVLKHVHYQTDADALVVVVDSDDSPLHSDQHEKVTPEPRCRLCRLRSVVTTESPRLKPIINRVPVKCAIGLAVPAIEAWYLCGLDPQVNEATWERRLRSESITYTRESLKEAVYGTDRPNIEISTRRATEAARRLVDQLDLLEVLFPSGFASFAREIRKW